MPRPSKHPQPDPPVETDERFPSGPWLGFWIQRPSTSRQWMKNLHLHFTDGRVIGAGSDWVGDFTFQGAYDLDTGKVTLRKQYLGAHAIAYEGQNENDGQWLWGLWTLPLPGLPPDQGGFHLWPKGTPDPTQPRLKEKADLPKEEPVPVG